jgi:hypothetical protein
MVSWPPGLHDFCFFFLENLRSMGSSYIPKAGLRFLEPWLWILITLQIQKDKLHGKAQRRVSKRPREGSYMCWAGIRIDNRCLFRLSTWYIPT